MTRDEILPATVDDVIITKICRGCFSALPLSCFSKNKRSRDGFDWRCRKCKGEQNRCYIHSNKGKDTRGRYYQATKERWADAKRIRRADYADKNPEKVWARWLLGNAVRRGYIPKPSNDRNWTNNWEFHHPDYNRPYYGVWLPISKHRRVDLGELSCPPCHDYTREVLDALLGDWGLERFVMLVEVPA